MAVLPLWGLGVEFLGTVTSPFGICVPVGAELGSRSEPKCCTLSTTPNLYRCRSPLELPEGQVLILEGVYLKHLPKK